MKRRSGEGTGEAAAGYSGTALGKKLGVKDGQRTLRVGMPANVTAEIAEGGARPLLLRDAEAGLEMAHVFTVRREKLRMWLKRLRGLMAPAGTVWVSWPKKASGMATDITDNVVREEALPLGFVDVKVCAVDGVWSGLKLVIRTSER